MSKPAAIAASLVDVRNIAAHKCIRLEIHVPAEQASLVLQAFGWPTAVDPVPVAIARLKPEKSASEAPPRSAYQARITSTTGTWQEGELQKPRRKFHDLPLPQQAALRCNEAAFQLFVSSRYPDIDWLGNIAEAVRAICGVQSRADLATDAEAAIKWRRLNGDYEAWLREAEVLE